MSGNTGLLEQRTMNELATMFKTGRGAMARVSMRWHVCSDDRGHFTKTIWGRVDRRKVDTALAKETSVLATLIASE